MNQNTGVASLPAHANGWIVMDIGYNEGWIMPVEDGLKLIEALKAVRQFKEPYNERPTISTLPPVRFKYISQEQMDVWDVQEILNV